MALEVLVPEDYLGDVIGNINSRRGRIAGITPRRNAHAIDALVPLSDMFGYATQLRSLTQGRAVFTMQFSRYEPVPAEVSAKILEKPSMSRMG